MKKSAIANSAGFLIFSALGAFSSHAFAQSSVMLFGVIDEGLNYASNVGGKSSWQTASGDLAISRWGLKGSEDLGGGLHAIFDLESGFALDNGAAAYGGRLFGYQSYVGLQSDSYGTLTFGRQFDSVADTVGLLTANGNWAGFLFSHPLDNDNTDATYHASNAVKYTSPTWAGFSATALYGFSNQAGAFANNRIFSAGLNYTWQTLTLAAVYADLGAPGANASGAIASDDMGFAARNQKTWGIGANYGIGEATLGLVYTRANVMDPQSSIYVGALGLGEHSSLKFDNIEVNARYNVTPAVIVGAMYTYTHAALDQDTGRASLHWNQWGAMVKYLFSKRTSVYGQVIYQAVSGGNTGTALDGAYVPGSAGVSSNSHQVVARIAMNHTF
ncbi:porin [Paraburkholderia bannensis]|uniref:porin n=1 Tax=Paraburkholderia bannensis TaxID=765414 RepID=UPI0005A8DCE0|nr:porin [Paraburkholderia bannensis]